MIIKGRIIMCFSLLTYSRLFKMERYKKQSGTPFQIPPTMGVPLTQNYQALHTVSIGSVRSKLDSLLKYLMKFKQGEFIYLSTIALLTFLFRA